VHVINAGRVPTDASGLLSSQRLTITLEALARSYDYVVLDAGALPDVSAEPFAKLAPRAVLVVSGPDDPGTTAGRERLLAAGFASVSVLAGAPRGPQSGLASARAAA
jgi:Mrp family chromosome partitioning ATPase